MKDFKYLKKVSTSELTPKSATDEVSTRRRVPRSRIEADDRPRDEATNYTIMLQLDGIRLVYSFRSSTREWGTAGLYAEKKVSQTFLLRSITARWIIEKQFARRDIHFVVEIDRGNWDNDERLDAQQK